MAVSESQGGSKTFFLTKKCPNRNNDEGRENEDGHDIVASHVMYLLVKSCEFRLDKGGW